MIKKSFYHQIENTNLSEFSTCVYHHNSWEFNSPHFHKNFELLLVIRGQCEYAVGGKTHLMKEGDAIFVLPFQVHRFTVSEGASVQCINFSDLLILTLAKQFRNKKLIDPVFRPSPETMHFFTEKLIELFGAESLYNNNIPQAKRMKLKGCLYTIGGEVLEKTGLASVGGSDLLIMDVVEYIADHYKTNISLRDVAEAKGYNYQYLSRLFNHVFGINFKTMLNQYRAGSALELLRDSDLSLSEIAFESGFQSIRSFDHVFRNQFGRPPKDFRREKG